MWTKLRRLRTPRPSALAYFSAAVVFWAVGAAEAQLPSAGHGSPDTGRVIPAPLASMWGTGDGMGAFTTFSPTVTTSCMPMGAMRPGADG
jgi:hypothetical protein